MLCSAFRKGTALDWIAIADARFCGCRLSNLLANMRSKCAWAGDHPEQALRLVNRMLFENTDPRASASPNRPRPSSSA
jgi:hypothetical protein